MCSKPADLYRQRWSPCLVGLTLLLWAVALGCSPSSTLSSVSCEGDQDCPEAQAHCVQGYCVMVGDTGGPTDPGDRDASSPDDDVLQGDLDAAMPDAALPDVDEPQDVEVIPVTDTGCSSGFTQCVGTQCVDLQTNAAHCGECSRQCEINFECIQGQCHDKCTDQQTRCGFSCVNTTNNPVHCGECNEVCTDAPADEEAICLEGQCTFTCPEEHRPCGVDCVPQASSQQQCGDACVDLQTDPDHCNGCGEACEQAPTNGLRICEGGECLIRCQEGFQFCGDQCLGPDEPCQICDPQFEGAFGGGFGTEASPYLLCAPDHIQLIGQGGGQYLSAHFLMMEDVDLDGPIVMIGGPESHFEGHFDGGGHTLSQVSIAAPDQNLVGLFRVLGGGAVITDLVLDVDEIRGNQDVAALAGRSGGLIDGVEVRGNRVQGRHSVGGLVGNNGGTVFESLVYLEVVALVDTDSNPTTAEEATNDVGGIAGQNNGTIDGAGTTADVANMDGLTTGGVVGLNTGSISRAWSTGVIQGTEHVGGLVGLNVGVVEDSYAVGTVSGDKNIGGMVGSHQKSSEFPDGVLRRGYAAAAVAGDENVGAVIGERGTFQSGPAVVDIYWDQEVTQAEAIGAGAGGGTVEVTARGTDQFGDADNLEHLDFQTIWEIGTVDGVPRPRLQWQP